MTTDFSDWIGRSETHHDMIEPSRSNALLAALGGMGDGAAGKSLPLLHHWLYFWDVRPPAGLGADGHPKRGGFLPPVPLPRRMWAGGRLRFIKPLVLGDTATRVSTVTDVRQKDGRSGRLVFVTVRHELSGTEGPAIVEEQDLVYREAAAPGSVPPPGADVPIATGEVLRSLTPDPVLLFRYSALTMNGHRIHYDRPYAIDEEAYPDLVVHAPLQATLLAAAAADALGRAPRSFEFRGQSPAFAGAPLHIVLDRNDGGATVRTVQGGRDCLVATIAADPAV